MEKESNDNSNNNGCSFPDECSYRDVYMRIREYVCMRVCARTCDLHTSTEYQVRNWLTFDSIRFDLTINLCDVKNLRCALKSIDSCEITYTYTNSHKKSCINEHVFLYESRVTRNVHSTIELNCQAKKWLAYNLIYVLISVSISIWISFLLYSSRFLRHGECVTMLCLGLFAFNGLSKKHFPILGQFLNGIFLYWKLIWFLCRLPNAHLWHFAILFG